MRDQANEMGSNIGYLTSSADIDINVLTKSLGMQPAPGEQPPVKLPTAAVKDSNSKSMKTNTAPLVLDAGANSADVEAPKSERASGSDEVRDEF